MSDSPAPHEKVLAELREEFASALADVRDAGALQQLKDSYRKELAVHYISRPELTIEAIAALMGFQDNSAFYRSFKKWTGLTPGQFRDQLDNPGAQHA